MGQRLPRLIQIIQIKIDGAIGATANHAIFVDAICACYLCAIDGGDTAGAELAQRHRDSLPKDVNLAGAIFHNVALYRHLPKGG